MKRYLYLFVVLISFQLNASDSAFYVGVKTDSSKKLRDVCEEYFKDGFLEGDVNMYLRLLPPRASKYEKEIKEAFSRKREKEIGSISKPIFSKFKFRKIVKKTSKKTGLPVVSIRVDYQLANSKKKRNGICFFEEEESGIWFLGQMP